LYDGGCGVAKNDKEAVWWWRKAAEQGDASAQCRLGLMYMQGQGVTKSTEEAMRWLRMAAEKGDANAKNILMLL
jgi:TPR repeat protein